MVFKWCLNKSNEHLPPDHIGRVISSEIWQFSIYVMHMVAGSINKWKKWTETIFAKNFARNCDNNNTWNIGCLIDEFVPETHWPSNPATQQPSVLYWRLTDFRYLHRKHTSWVQDPYAAITEWPNWLKGWLKICLAGLLFGCYGWWQRIASQGQGA